MVTSLGRLTRATERPIFGHEIRNKKKSISAAKKHLRVVVAANKIAVTNKFLLSQFFISVLFVKNNVAATLTR